MKKTITLLFLTLLSSATFSQVGLKINEVDYDQQSVDTLEFLEIYNSDANGIDLSNYTVLLVNGFNNTPYDTITLPAQTLAPGDYFVICGNGGQVPNCDLVLPVLSNIIQNGAPDAIAIVENGSGNVVDVVSYEGSVGAPYVEGTGIPAGQSDTTVLVPDLLGISRFPDGADTNDNSVDFRNSCSTPGGANSNSATNCVTGISSVTDLMNTVRVYPNPTKGISVVDCRGMNNASISVRNVLGMEIKSVVLNSHETSYTCDLTGNPDGVYFVKIKSEAGEATRRLILRK